MTKRKEYRIWSLAIPLPNNDMNRPTVLVFATDGSGLNHILGHIGSWDEGEESSSYVFFPATPEDWKLGESLQQSELDDLLSLMKAESKFPKEYV